jgi:hypothetical protein
MSARRGKVRQRGSDLSSSADPLQVSRPNNAAQRREGSMGVLQRWVQTKLRRFGYELTASRHLSHVAMAAYVRELFDCYAIQTVLDVGANEGQYWKFLRREVGFKGNIVSFEPVRALWEQLRIRAARDPRWLVYPLALGEFNEQREINVTALSSLSSFLRPGA